MEISPGWVWTQDLLVDLLGTLIWPAEPMQALCFVSQEHHHPEAALGPALAHCFAHVGGAVGHAAAAAGQARAVAPSACQLALQPQSQCGLHFVQSCHDCCTPRRGMHCAHFLGQTVLGRTAFWLACRVADF